MKTKVVRFQEFGGSEVLRFESLEVGEPGAGEVRVSIEAIGLNRAGSPTSWTVRCGCCFLGNARRNRLCRRRY
jgi:hypothetical protein